MGSPAARQRQPLGHVLHCRSGKSVLTGGMTMPGFIRSSMPAMLFMVALVPATVSGQVTPLDFRAAYERLGAQNEQLGAVRMGVDQAQSRQRAADAARLPSFEIVGSVTRLDSDVEIDLGGVRRRIDETLGITLPPNLLPNGLPIQDRNFGNLALQAVQPVYLGGRINAAREAARAGLAADTAVVDRTFADLVVALVKQYFGQSVAADALAVRRQSVESLRQLAFNARRLEEEGEISRADRLRADVALIEAEGELASARERLTLAQQALTTLLSERRVVEPLTGIPAVPAPSDAGEWRLRAVESNPSLIELGARLDQAKAALRAEQGTLRPELLLLGRRELYTEGLSEIRPEWSLSLVANWRFADGGVRRARVSEAQARRTEIEFLQNALTRQVELLVDQQIEAQHTALERHRTFGAATALADESLRVQRRAFEEGFATSLDVIEAELARARVALGELLARYEAWVATAAIYAASGQVAALVDRIEESHDD
ncbi:MAG: TolC family protein [Wenzhouxiangellaceae bacterium]|nr:TolC family protein [Wenzhouxiangellaceae bacterium]